jgi:hypothetical protein
MVLKILKYGEPVLEQPADHVSDFNTPDLKKLVEDMFDTMYAAKGVGLAAPQIGISKRVTVIDISVGEDETKKLVLINPEIVTREGTQVKDASAFPAFANLLPAPTKSPSKRTTKRARPSNCRAKNCWRAPFNMKSITSTASSSSII